MYFSGTRFIFAEQKDSDEVKEYMEPLIKKNSEMHKIRMKLATGMVYLSDANGSNQILSELSGQAFMFDNPIFSKHGSQPRKTWVNFDANLLCYEVTVLVTMSVCLFICSTFYLFL